MKSLGSCMMAACMAGMLCLASEALSQAPASPPKGQVAVSSVAVTATVEKIDQKTREVTLKADDGQEFSFVAGDGVQNLAQVKKGDRVTATYTEAIAYEVKRGGATGTETMAAAAAAPLGAKPAGVVAQATTVTVKVTAIDSKVPSVTFEGPAGNTRTIKVKDPAKLQGVNVGDTVDISYVEAVGIKVEKAPKS